MEMYAYYSTYSLYAAQLAVSCYLYADDRVPEVPAPCDIGGHVLHIPSFYRTYAVTGAGGGNQHITVDHFAQFGHDATGLVRFHRDGVPGELALSVGIPGSVPNEPAIYLRPRLSELSPEAAACIGIAWRDSYGAWHRLSQNGRSKHEVFNAIGSDGQPLQSEKSPWSTRVDILERAAKSIVFQVVYIAANHSSETESMNEFDRRVFSDRHRAEGVGGCKEIRETYRMDEVGLTIEWELIPVVDGGITAMAVLVPILATNGLDLVANDMEESVLKHVAESFKAKYLGHKYVIQPDKTISDHSNEELIFELFPGLMPNRNGLYRLAQWTYRNRNSIRFNFRLE